MPTVKKIFVQTINQPHTTARACVSRKWKRERCELRFRLAQHDALVTGPPQNQAVPKLPVTATFAIKIGCEDAKKKQHGLIRSEKVYPRALPHPSKEVHALPVVNEITIEQRRFSV